MTMIKQLPYGYEFVLNVSARGNLIATIKDYDEFHGSYVCDIKNINDNSIEHNVLIPVYKLVNVIQCYIHNVWFKNL